MNKLDKDWATLPDGTKIPRPQTTVIVPAVPITIPQYYDPAGDAKFVLSESKVFNRNGEADNDKV